MVAVSLSRQDQEHITVTAMSSLAQDEITQVSPHQLSKVVQRTPEGVMVHLQCLLDWICHHLGDTYLGITVRKWFTGEGRCNLEVGVTIPWTEGEAKGELSRHSSPLTF